MPGCSGCSYAARVIYLASNFAAVPKGGGERDKNI